MSKVNEALPVFYPATHHLHQPRKDHWNGLAAVEHPEVPDRLDKVLSGIRAAGKIAEFPIAEQAQDQVRALHDHDYVDFLLEIEKTIPEGDEYLPNFFRADLSRAPLTIRGGMYSQETSTPIGAASIQAALNAAATADAAAQYMVNHSCDAAALCRPPGHHAGPRRYGGYCFFNNAYLAARRLSRNGRCAVLDLDYHLGDGSVEFASKEIPYFSLHADPWRNYPHIDAHADLEAEYLDLVIIPEGTDGQDYLKMLSSVLNRIDHLDLDFLVVSLGFDLLGTDQVQDDSIALTPVDFQVIAKSISKLKARTCILLEGGYDLENLGSCAENFARGLGLQPNQTV